MEVKVLVQKEYKSRSKRILDLDLKVVVVVRNLSNELAATFHSTFNFHWSARLRLSMR